MHLKPVILLPTGTVFPRLPAYMCEPTRFDRIAERDADIWRMLCAVEVSVDNPHEQFAIMYSIY